MHTFTGEDATFIYNGDLSGDVTIRRVYPDKGNGSTRRIEEIHVPSDDLLDFVANHVRSQRIGQLEQMPTGKVLGIE